MHDAPSPALWSVSRGRKYVLFVQTPERPENRRGRLCERWRHADTLPMFRAMDAGLAHEVGNHGERLASDQYGC
jgi:hypothetical protein